MHYILQLKISALDNRTCPIYNIPMTKELTSKIKEILEKHSTEAYKCLYPPSGWQWGCCSRKYKLKTLALMNNILKNIPTNAWPDKDSEDSNVIKIKDWRLSLMWIDGKMAADLAYSKDDHTAWVTKRGKKFVNFDIGGS